MKKVFLVLFAFVLVACSGIAPEAERDDSSLLVKPPFFKKDLQLLNTPVVELYTKPKCPFCIKAKALLDSKEIKYLEYNLTERPDLVKEAIERSKRTSVPQIFIRGKHVGGFEELQALENSKSLKKMVDG